MAIADVYDALITRRVYKPAYSHEQAKKIIQDGKGTHFDPLMVDAFLALEKSFQKIAKAYTDEPSD
jgi:putative two-component system response regulator